ncbi:PREDICTED: eukaryotic translation initiation factor 5B-like [Bactrocera latifrons]|uniref:eukaryotic translation initiation factor 5B-like n=1 Tax=Bactrocera latifrons TaxID=174628 RepID=UPI0008DE45F8|nr:PREDICTED: eukaryotic translation initiation factor 5B-like [Bactrocera latifrons]
MATKLLIFIVSTFLLLTLIRSNNNVIAAETEAGAVKVEKENKNQTEAVTESSTRASNADDEESGEDIVKEEKANKNQTEAVTASSASKNVTVVGNESKHQTKPVTETNARASDADDKESEEDVDREAIGKVSIQEPSLPENAEVNLQEVSQPENAPAEEEEIEAEPTAENLQTPTENEAQQEIKPDSEENRKQKNRKPATRKPTTRKSTTRKPTASPTPTRPAKPPSRYNVKVKVNGKRVPVIYKNKASKGKKKKGRKQKQAQKQKQKQKQKWQGKRRPKSGKKRRKSKS